MDSRTNVVRIGCASAFWGDTQTAAQQLLENSHLDFLVFDYLSEVTLALLAKEHRQNPENAGFVPDFYHLLTESLLDLIQQKPVKIISNAGGLNPSALANQLEAWLSKHGITLTVAVVTGDNIPASTHDQKKPVLTANVYLGATPIAKALEMGADIVITGRCVDSALTLGPLMHAFNWPTTEYDKLAQGALAGHLIECGTQVTGGNYTDWATIRDFSNMGFPIVECYANGDFVVTKPEHTGGVVNTHTVMEQLLYEIADPCRYFLPDVCCDFSEVTLKMVGPNRIDVSGARGHSPGPNYKVIETSLHSYRALAHFLVVGDLAKEKARITVESLLRKIARLLQQRGLPPISNWVVDYLGSEACYQHLAHVETQNTRELVVRLGISHPSRQGCQLFAQEIAQAATAMPPGMVALIGGRPSIQPEIGVSSYLIKKLEVPIQITCQTQTQNMVLGDDPEPPVKSDQPLTFKQKNAKKYRNETEKKVLLRQLVLARSGDKGHDVNIGVIARSSSIFWFLDEILTETSLAQYFLSLAGNTIEKYTCPHLLAFNFVLRNCLASGLILGHADHQGKGYAQLLLDMPTSIPQSLLKSLTEENLHGHHPILC